MAINREEEKNLIIDSIREVLAIDKLQDRDMLSVALYRCLDLYYREHGEHGLENVLRMWDDISKLSS